MPAVHRPLSRLRKGFNLIETAIVLGVVGLVIGGIWVAASAAYDRQKSNELASTILRMVDGTRTLFPMNAWPAESTGYTSITSLLIQAGYVPLFSGGTAKTPWGDSFNCNLLYPPMTNKTIYFHIPVPTQLAANRIVESIIKTARGGLEAILCSDGIASNWWWNPGDSPIPNCPVKNGLNSLTVAVYFYP